MSIAVDTLPTLDPDTTSDSEYEETPEEPRMIGDFDGSSNELWTLYKEEARNHDNAQIVSIKDYMESPLLFVRSDPVCT
jgi:hypothetical protein